MTDQTPYQRMLDWCQQILMADAPTIVEGQRTIRYTPHKVLADERWQGTIAHPQFEQTTWQGPHVESVIKQMDAACGPVAEAAYDVREG